MDDVLDEVRNHARKIRDKKEELFPTPQLSAHKQRSMELKEEMLKIQQLTLEEKKLEKTSKQQDLENQNSMMAETEANVFLGECTVLGDLMQEELWSEADDAVISNCMRDLSKWQEQWNAVERAFRQYENMAIKHKFSETRKEAIRVTYEDRKDRFENARDAIKKEDVDRCLYTLEPARTDIMKYPTFSGNPSEDYLTFKETMEKRFRENKVNKKEQAAKLRECLQGPALARVPHGVKDIEEAFRRLNEAFGNPSKIMAFNLKALEDLGFLPPDKLPSGQFSFGRRIEWLLKLEVILAKIIELSKRSSKLAHEAFASSTYRKLWARFPTSVIDKLVKVQGEDAERLQGILDKIVKMREHAQVMDDECGSSITVAKKQLEASPPSKVTAEIFFRVAQRYEECRVCTHLSATSQHHPDLFENHVSNYVTGCPKFIEASTEKRLGLATKIKLCRQCFHPEVIFVDTDHFRECQFSQKKNSYSCQNKNCRDHMWICLAHKVDNRKAMQKFQRDLKKQGYNLAFLTALPSSHQTNQDNFEKAVRKIKRLENGSELVPVPEGEPIFLFHATQGKSEPVRTFYDSGCSHAVFREGVPGKQLKGQIVSKGPFNIDGIGGLKTSANDEWVCSVARTDGRKQLIQGLAVNRITSDFPLTNLETATRDIKNDDPHNSLLQNCRAPPIAGGSVDMLLGIKYSSIFPKEIHTLPNGLTIYQSRLASHGGEYDSCIGGPHSSFAALADSAGGAARLLGYFIDGLKTFRQLGPPKLTSINMNDDEVAVAKAYNAAEGEFVEFAELSNVTDIESDMSESEDQTEEQFRCCNHCTERSSSQVSSDERISEFKKCQEMHESGLEVEYRCPKCRDCLYCKSADKTERISIKEESEMFQIRKSIELDFDNQKIQSYLPLRGKERDYLSSNRDRAAKVLAQQCKKYHGDAENKDVILEAFNKLFKNGHAKLLSQLSQSELDQFMDKEVQHHLVWRVVFSASPTTPCRPVMDASSRTPFRRDGSGGKSLNDLVCKGKIESLNLVKVLMRFMTGKYAMTGDLKQFYNACKLNASQWNLQRFLWVDNLDPSGEVLEGVITTLIYGVTSVSAQSELAMKDLAEYIREREPELALLLLMSRYVDDLQESKATQEECINLAKVADEVFASVGLECKAWTFSGLPPSPVISKDELSVGIFGVFAWYSEGDLVESKIPKLHFGKAKRGKLAKAVDFFEGHSEEDMDNFVPHPLTKRQAASKLASVWDLMGKLSPILVGMKQDLRDTFLQLGPGMWDVGMTLDLRQRWVRNFWVLEQLRGIKFSRAIMPTDAVNSKMRILTGVDASKTALMMGCWAGFELKDGSWSNKLLIGRSLLSKNESIPKSELDANCGGSNLAWVVRLALKEWVDKEIIFSDSMIALCWITSEKLRLSLFHRNRVLQIRRGTELENIYHVRTNLNPADCGTRPEKVKISDLGSQSRWENGDPWMTLPISQAVKEGVLKAATELRVSKDMESDYNDGLIFKDQEDIFSRGHFAECAAAVSEVRVKKIQERANFSQYLLLPTKYSFSSTVRIYGYIISFVKNARQGRKMLGEMLKEAKLWFSVFSTDLALNNSSCVKIMSKVHQNSLPGVTKVLGHFTLKKLTVNNMNQKKLILTENSLHQALLYLFRKSSNEVHKFVSKKVINKIAYEVDGILLSKGRLLDGLNFKETGELGNINLGSLGVKLNTPVLDRWSPLSYSIGQHVHWNLGKHKGIETSNRLSLQSVTIMQGMTLYRELAEECIRCHMKRKKLV